VNIVVWVFSASCVLEIPMLAWRGDSSAASVLIGVVFVEVAVLVLKRWCCPLKGVAARHTNDRWDDFDIFLPEWVARHNTTIFGGIYVARILMTLARGTDRSARRRMKEPGARFVAPRGGRLAQPDGRRLEHSWPTTACG
jgi:hypothetical protein